jgi:hypothetical protein
MFLWADEVHGREEEEVHRAEEVPLLSSLASHHPILNLRFLTAIVVLARTGGLSARQSKLSKTALKLLCVLWLLAPK